MSTVDPADRPTRGSRRREPDGSDVPLWKRPVVIAAAVVVLLVVVIGAVLLTGGSDDSDDAPAAIPAPTVTPLEQLIVLAPASFTAESAADAIGCKKVTAAPVKPPGSSTAEVCTINKSNAVIITFPDNAALKAWAAMLPGQEFSGAPAETATVAVLVNKQSVANAVKKGLGA